MEISKLAYPESFILVVQNGEIESQENFMILEEVQKYIHRKLGINLGEQAIFGVCQKKIQDLIKFYFKT